MTRKDILPVFHTDLDSCHHICNMFAGRMEYVEIQRYNNALYVSLIKASRYTNHNLLAYPATITDWNYCKNVSWLDGLHPERRLMNLDEIEHPPLSGYWESPVAFAHVTDSGLFTVTADILRKDTHTLMQYHYSYWEFKLLYSPCPMAEVEFYIHALR